MDQVVVKLGGSLLDLPGLEYRLEGYFASLPSAQTLLLAGGGAAANEVRARYREGKLTEDEAHWLAIRAMRRNGRRLARALRTPVLLSHAGARVLFIAPVIVLDPHALLREEEADGGNPLPRSWQVTADSIAARLACYLDVGSLILLKSRAIASASTLEQAACEGVVDAHLPAIASGLEVSLVNFRQEPPEVCCQWPPSGGQAGRGGEH